MKRFPPRLADIIFILFIILTFVLSAVFYSPPKIVSDDAPEDQFSAERAFSHILNIAQKPHGVGMMEHSRVKEYIKKELKRLGLEYGEQNTTAIHDAVGIRAAYVSNLYGILRGNGHGKKAILFCGHYDSCPHTPGAADDGSAIAAMLEGARALSQGGALDNDIIFLFTDGEELGLFGAKAFTEEHSLMNDIGLVLNIEARGSRGPVLAYEYNIHNGWVIKEMNRAMPRLFSNSIAYEIYKRMPNDTDFTLFREAGLTGINIAFINDYANYHSMMDSPENLNLNSLQHQGDYLISTALHFGNLDLSDTRSRDAIFFNWFGSSMVIYSTTVNWVLIIGVMFLAVVFFYQGFKRGHLRWGRVLLGFVSFIITVVIVLFTTWVLLKLIKKWYPHYTAFYDMNFYNVRYYFFSFSALSLTIYSSLNILLKKWFSLMELFSGVIISSLLFMWVMHVYIPTGSYVFIIPSILLLSAGTIALYKNLSFKENKFFFLLTFFLAYIPIIGLFLPYISLFFVALGLGFPYGGLILLIFLWGYLAIPFHLLQKKREWVLPSLSLFVVLACLLLAHIHSKPSRDRPIQTSLNYYFDADSSRAFWVSERTVPDAWNGQFFENGVFEPLVEIYPHAKRSRLKNSAPRLPMLLPEMTIVSDTVINENRQLEIEILTSREASFCELFFHRDSGLTIMSLNDRDVNQEAYINYPIEYCEVQYHGLSDQPLAFTIRSQQDKPIEMFIVERSPGIRIVEGYDPLPDWVIPTTGYNSYQEIVKKTWRF